MQVGTDRINLIYNDSGEYCGPGNNYSQDLIDTIEKGNTAELFVLSIITLIGVIGNILVLVVSTRSKDLKTTNNTMITLLAISDLTYLIVIGPSMAVEHTVADYPFGKIYCKVSNYAVYILMYITIYFLCIMSVDRFLAILFPLRSKVYRTKRNLNIACVCAFVFACVVNVQALLVHNTIYLTENNTCVIKCKMTDTTVLFGQVTRVKVFVTSMLMLSYILPLLIITIMYTCICVELIHLKGRRISDTTANSGNHMRAAFIVLALEASFFLCWTPLHVFGFLLFFTNTIVNLDYKYAYIYLLVSSLLSVLNSSLNPLLYTFLSAEYRECLMSLFRSCNATRRFGSSKMGTASTHGT